MDVVLREWRPEDAAAIAPMVHDEHIRRWSSMGSNVEAWIARQQSGVRGPSLAVCLAGSGRAVGKVALRMPGHASPATTCQAVRPADAPVGELSYWLVPQVRGRGLAYPAVRMMMETVVAASGLRSVVLDIEIENRRSARLAERLGAERRDPQRSQPDRHGAPRTLVVFVLRVPADHPADQRVAPDREAVTVLDRAGAPARDWYTTQ